MPETLEKQDIPLRRFGKGPFENAPSPLFSLRFISVFSPVLIVAQPARQSNRTQKSPRGGTDPTAGGFLLLLLCL
jgi:hypothetical protein